MALSDTVRVLSSGPQCPGLALVEGAGAAHAIVWPGVGAKLRSMHRITLGSRSRTVGQSHSMEAVYYVIAGSGSVAAPSCGAGQPLVVGSMVHVEPGTAYQFKADASGLELVGGPCPADPALYR